MNILYYPQISMYDKQTKKIIAEADGNINMMRNFINEWKKYRPNDYFYIMLPSELKNNFICGIEANRTLLFYDDYVVSARINRYNFPMNEFCGELHELKIDLVITDVIELARNFKSMFNVEFGYNPKIISNIRHVDEIDARNGEYDYTFRVIDGIQCSDYVTILSDSMKEILSKNLESILDVDLKNELLEKIQVFEPSISENELLSKTLVFERDADVIITFPGRLSKGEERRTNYDKFIKAIAALRTKRQDFKVYFTDPNNNMTEDLKGNLQDWIFTIPKNRYKFTCLLAKTDVIVSLMDIQGFGGISIREALLFNCRPVIPYVHEYKKMAPKKYLGYINEVTTEQIISALDWVVDQGKKDKTKMEFYKYGKQFTIEQQMPNLMSQLEVILNEK